MKLFQKVCLVFASVVFTAGCTTLNTSQYNGPLHVSVDAPLKADVKVGEKISGNAFVKTLFGFIVLDGANFGKYADGINYGMQNSDSFVAQMLARDNSKLMAAAAYDAVHKSGADIIIAPKYVIEVEDNFFVKKTSATVTGYKGTITGIKER